MIHNNVLSAFKKPKKFTLRDRFKDRTTKNAVKKLMVSRLNAKHKSENNMEIRSGEFTVRFWTDPTLKQDKAWERIMKVMPPQNINSESDLKRYIHDTADMILLNPALPAAEIILPFIQGLSENDPSVAYQGIVIGGVVAEDVQIYRNKVDRFLQGIHVGLSHSAPRNIHDEITSVKIEKNVIKNILPSVLNYGRHGIFVGNCRSVSISDNELELNRNIKASRYKIDGIMVYGILGRKVNVSKNNIFGSHGQNRRENMLGSNQE